MISPSLSSSIQIQQSRVKPASSLRVQLLRLPLLFLTAATTTTTRAMSTTSTNKSTNKPAALIFLHGLGDTPSGWSSLQNQLPKIEPSLSSLTYKFPPAPTIPISINNGMTMPGWFDLYDWPIGIGIKNDEVGLNDAVTIVEQCVNDLETNHGVSRDRIVIGGFSQGGAVALRAAFYNHNKKDDDDDGPPFAACVSLSGWVTFSNLHPGGSSVKDIPLFLGHGSYDDKVLFEQQNHAEITLSGEGVTNIESKAYNMGHSSHPQEMIDMAKFLKQVLFETNEKEVDEK